MGTEVYELDLHISYTHSYYDGDSNTRCTVTYPPFRTDQQPFQVVYDDHYGDLSQDTVAANVAKDIAKYMQDPKGWLEVHIKQSGDDWEQLRELQHDLAESQRRIGSAQKTIGYNQDKVAKYQKQITALEAKLKENT